MSKTLVEASKPLWTTTADPPTHQDIQTGCLQRIATACEATAKNWDELVRERDAWQEQAHYYAERATRLERSNAALRGVITKLKKGKK